jgi:NADH-quinone oxidoreductase subunit G
MPDSHRLNFHYIDGETRLTQVLIKENGTHRTAEWAEAISKISATLAKYDPSEIAVIASARMTNEELFLVHTLAGDLKTGQFATVARMGENDGLLIAADRNPNTTGAKLIWDSSDPAAPLFAIREGVRSGAIKALLVLGEDLTAEAGFNAEDLAKPEFIASVQLLAGATADASHVVLPGAAFAEKRGSMVNLTGRLQRLNRAIEPQGQCRDDWEILRDLAAAISGNKSDVFIIEDLFKKIATSVKEFEGLTLSKIGDQGKIITETGYEIPLLKNERARAASGIING